MNKPMYKSLTNIGTTIFGLGGLWSLYAPSVTSAAVTTVGVVVAAWGVRGWPIINGE